MKNYFSCDFLEPYDGPERRIAKQQRRSKPNRRHRNRTESLVCDCRVLPCRRREDEDGLAEALLSLYNLEKPNSLPIQIIIPK